MGQYGMIRLITLRIRIEAPASVAHVSRWQDGGTGRATVSVFDKQLVKECSTGRA
jgi:hypothetical protein